MTFLHLIKQHHYPTKTRYDAIITAALCLLMGSLPTWAGGPLVGLATEHVSHATAGDMLQATRLKLTTAWGAITLTCTGPAAIIDRADDSSGRTLFIGRFRGVLTTEDAAFISEDEDIFYLVLDQWGEPMRLDIHGGRGDDVPLSVTTTRTGFRIKAYAASQAGNGQNGLITLHLDRWETILQEETHNPELIPSEKPPMASIEDDSGEGETEDPEG